MLHALWGFLEATPSRIAEKKHSFVLFEIPRNWPWISILFEAANQISVGSRDLRAEFDSFELQFYPPIVYFLYHSVVNRFHGVTECVALATVSRKTTCYHGLKIKQLTLLIIATFTAVKWVWVSEKLVWHHTRNNQYSLQKISRALPRGIR